MGLQFAECEIDIDRRELRRDGEFVSVEPQVFDVLSYLVNHRDRVVPKTELLDEIWGDRFVSESALSSRIKSARKAIGDTGRDQRLIKTIHARGFRFVGAIDEARRAERPSAPPALADDPVLSVIDALRSGEGMALIVSGPPESDKTHHLERARDQAVAEGFLAGWGSVAGAGLRMFGCVIDAIDEIVQRAPELLDELPSGVRDELAECLAGQPPSTRQRLFLAVRELLVRAAATRGVCMVIDDVHLADSDTLALIEHAARLTRHHRVAVLCAHRPGDHLGPGFVRVDLDEPEDGRASRPDPGAELPPEVTKALGRVALGGPSFDDLELEAASGAEPAMAERLIDLALDSGLVEAVTGGGYRFARPDHAARLAAGIPPHHQVRIHRETADRLVALDAPPDRIAQHLLAANDPAAAAPFALDAARAAMAARMHKEVLRWTGSVVDHAEGAERLELLTMRGESLVAAGDPTAVQAYRDALAIAPAEVIPGIRVGLARAAMLSGDFEAAMESMEGLEPDGGPYDGPILLAQGMLSFFSGDIERASVAVDAAREFALAPGAPTRLLDVITLQGMVAHSKGEWFDRLLRELRNTKQSPEMAATIFDCHLCVAEYLLYGPTPYSEVVALARELRENAERIGAQRAAAFAACVAGEAELLAGNLDEARRDLEESVEMHRDLNASTGLAHSLQRLAEVELAAGNRALAEQLAREALPLARWSPFARHLVQRTYGSLIATAADLECALEVVDEAREILDEPSSCVFCHVMVAVPSAIACAEAGRLEEARQHLKMAEASARNWEGTAWQGAVTEARACLVRAEGDPAQADKLLVEAASLFQQAGQPLDAERCLEAIGD